jgi:hypothetical protein
MKNLAILDLWLGQRMHIDHDVKQVMHLKSNAHLNLVLDEHASFTLLL